jgi:hypothetical protein
MGDADLTASVHLINGILTQLGKDEPVTASFARHACSALHSRPLFTVTAGAGAAHKQQQQAALSDACSKLLDAVGRSMTKGPVSIGMTAAAAAAQSHHLFSKNQRLLWAGRCN